MTIEQLQKKKNILDIFLFFLILVFIFTIIIGFYYHWVFLLAIMTIPLSIYHQYEYKKLNIEFKKTHVKKMIEAINPGLLFIPEKGFDADFVFSSNILRRYTKFESEDFLSGTIKNKSFESADIRITQVVSTGKTTYVVTRFLGRLFIIDFKKKFEDDVYITTDRYHIPQNHNQMLKIETEAIEFNHKFNIYSKSEHSAFYLLTPRFMEKIDKLSSIAKHVMFAFKNDKAYIAVNTERDAFNIKFSDTLNDSYVENVKIELKLLEELIEFVPN